MDFRKLDSDGAMFQDHLEGTGLQRYPFPRKIFHQTETDQFLKSWVGVFIFWEFSVLQGRESRKNANHISKQKHKKNRLGYFSCRGFTIIFEKCALFILGAST